MSMLSDIHLYFLTPFRIQEFGEIHEGFFLWEGVDEGGGSHSIRWELVLSPIESRGLGISNLRLHNEALLAKVAVALSSGTILFVA